VASIDFPMSATPDAASMEIFMTSLVHYRRFGIEASQVLYGEGIGVADP